MAKKKFEQELAALDELRRSGASVAATEALRKALSNRNNYIVAKAARIAAEFGSRNLVGSLLEAFDRFLSDPVKTDPQCWAKIAIVRALAELGHDDPAVFVRSLGHVQMEPVWGGRADTAGPLRGVCALALAGCRQLSDEQALSYLVDAAFDADKTVRVEVVRAIGRFDRPEAALLLRLRALAGDPAPEVFGACCSALLSNQGRAALEFVGRFLQGEDDRASEAALAISGMRDAESFAMLEARYERGASEPLGSVLLSAIALTRQEAAVEYLLRLIRTEAPGAASAIAALAAAGCPEAVKRQASDAVEQSGSSRLRDTFHKAFDA